MLFLIGATGFTGTRIVQEIVAKALPATLVGSNVERLSHSVSSTGFDGAILCIDSEHIASLRSHLDSSSTVINCRGPFSLYSKEIARMCAEQGCRYFDITGEQSFVHYCQNELADLALSSGATLVNSCSFESAVVDWLAFESISTTQSYKAIHSFYDVGTNRPSPGTMLTMKLSHLTDTWEFRQGELELLAPGKRTIPIPFETKPHQVALFSPYPEVLYFSQRYDVSDVGSYTVVPDFMAASAEAGNHQLKTDTILEQFEAKRERIHQFADRASGPFRVTVAVYGSKGEKRQSTLLGRDPYGLTAALALFIASADMEQSVKGGVFSPAEYTNLSKFFLDETVQERFGLVYETD